MTNPVICGLDIDGSAPATVAVARAVAQGFDLPLLLVHVAPGDMGRVIGKRGRIAQSIRTVVRAAAVRDGAEVDVDFVD